MSSNGASRSLLRRFQRCFIIWSSLTANMTNLRNPYLFSYLTKSRFYKNFLIIKKLWLIAIWRKLVTMDVLLIVSWWTLRRRRSIHRKNIKKALIKRRKLIPKMKNVLMRIDGSIVSLLKVYLQKNSVVIL